MKINADFAHIYAPELGELTLHTFDESDVGFFLRAHGVTVTSQVMV
jgi:hypothetical protein